MKKETTPKTEIKKEERTDLQDRFLCLCIALGLVIGIVLGSGIGYMTNNFTPCMAVGTVFGLFGGVITNSVIESNTK